MSSCAPAAPRPRHLGSDHRESGALLVGERVPRASIRRIKQIISSDSAVEQGGKVLTMQPGPDEALLTVNVRFKRNLKVEQVEAAIRRIEDQIHQREPAIRQIFIEADSLK
jgi:divalent metal cation (Fe/Co/Zn/Cd) transporter